MDISVEQVKDFIKSMTLMQASQLVKQLEEELGVSAAPAMAMMPGMMAGGGAPAAEVEEQTEFSLVLENTGADKVKVIKVIRELTPLGLKEAKELAESAPKTVKEGMSKADAEEAKKKFEEVGAKASLK